MAKKSTDKKISPQELERMWKSVDLSNFWREVAEEVSREAEAYRHARAKSKAQAASTVFI